MKRRRRVARLAFYTVLQSYSHARVTYRYSHARVTYFYISVKTSRHNEERKKEEITQTNNGE